MNGEVMLNAAVCLRILETLAHFLWQGAALGLVSLLVAFFPRASSQTRYAILMSIFIAMALCPVLTFSLLNQSDSYGVVPTRAASAVSMDDPVTAIPVDTAPNPPTVAGRGVQSAASLEAPELPSASPRFRMPESKTLAPYAVLAYAVGVALMLLRLLVGLAGGKRLRLHSIPVDDSFILTMLAHGASALRLRVAPAVAYCKHVTVPTVAGIIRPMILLPFSFASGLTTDQVRYLLLHELAHIRRYDHVFNILQRIIEAFLFFHPAVWYLSRRIRFERELCCDDLVLSQGGEVRAYVESLVTAAALASRNVPTVANAAALSATGDSSQLRRRVQRLLGKRQPQVRLLRAGWIVGLLLLFIAVAAIALVNQPRPMLHQYRKIIGMSDSGVTHQALEALVMADHQPTSTSSPNENAENPFSAATSIDAQQTEVVADVAHPTAESPVADSNATTLIPTGQTSDVLNQLHDPDWWLRKLAIHQLAESITTYSVPAIIGALTDQDERVRIAAAESLGRIGDPKAVKHLVAVLKDNMVRDSAAEALAKFPPQQVMPVLRLAAIDSDSSVYGGSIAALARIKDPECLQLLTRLVFRLPENDPKFAERLRDALTTQTADDVSKTLATLATSNDKAARFGLALLLCPDNDYREGLHLTPEMYHPSEPFVAIAECPQLLELLAKLSTDADRDVRVAAVRAAGGWLAWHHQTGTPPPNELAPILFSALRDSNGNIGAEASRFLTLAELKAPTAEDQPWLLVAQGKYDEAVALGPPAFEPLIHVFQVAWDPVEAMNTRPSMRRQAIDRTVSRGSRDSEVSALRALAKLGDARAVPVLLKVLSTSSNGILYEITDTLGKLKSPEAVAPLIQLLQSPNPSIRASAASALGQLGDKSAVQPLIAYLKDNYISSIAARALGDLGDPAAIPVLLEVFNKDDDLSARDAAVTSLGKLHATEAAPHISAVFATPPASFPRAKDNDFLLDCIHALAAIGGPDAEKTLIGLLDERFARIGTTEVVKTLGDMNATQAAEPIGALLVKHLSTQDPSDTVFPACVSALRKLGGPKAVAALGDALRVSPLVEHRSPIADALANMPDPSASDALYTALSKTNSDLGSRDTIQSTFPIAIALAKRHDERARPMLEEYQKRPEFRIRAEEALRLLVNTKNGSQDSQNAEAKEPKK